METKLRKNLTNFEVIDYIQKDMTFNRKMAFGDMIEYIKGEINIYMHPSSIDVTEGEYNNIIAKKKLRLVTITTEGLKVIIREKITETADIKFIPLDADSMISGEKASQEELAEI